MRKIFSILGILLLLLLVMMSAGCTQGTSFTTPANPLSSEKSDDDLYLQSLDDYISVMLTPQPSSSSDSSTHSQMVDQKIKSESYYNRIASLKVSPKLDYSKTAFLQSLKDSEAVADYVLSMSEKDLMRISRGNSDTTATEKAQYSAMVQHLNNKDLFFRNAIDTNVCVLKNEKYPNISFMCNAIFKTGK